MNLNLCKVVVAPKSNQVNGFTKRNKKKIYCGDISTIMLVVAVVVDSSAAAACNAVARD